MSLTDDVIVALEHYGALSGWTDRYGEEQPAPKLQALFFDGQALGDERCAFVRVGSGAYGNKYVSSPSVTFAVFGLPDKYDSVIVQDRAEQIKKAIMPEFVNCGIIGHSGVTVSAVNFSESGRPFVIIDISLKIDNSYEE